MADSSFTQSSFLGGEWSPFAQGRSDLPSYRTALNVCRNGFPLEEGAWIRRSGTRFAATTLNGKPGRLIKFDFEQNAPYQMEFTDSALRFYAVAAQTAGLASPLPNDFRLATTNDNQAVMNISTASPAVVTTGMAHGWNSGDQVMFLFASSVSPSYLPLLRNRVFSIVTTPAMGASAFNISDPISLEPIDGSTLGFSAPAAGTMIAVRILNIATVYAAGAWATLRHIQAETESILLHADYPPYALNVSSLPTASDFAEFSLAEVTFTDGPYLDPPTDGSTITPSGTSGSVTLTASAITSINSGAGFVSTDVGRFVRLLSEPPTWDIGTAYNAGDAVTYNGAYFVCIDGNTGQEPDIAIGYWSISTTVATWSWAQITAITSASVVTATIMGAALLYTNAIATWRMGLYSEITGWPTCGVYYEGRLWLSGSVPNRVDASVVNAIAGGTVDMTPTATDGTVADSNAISYIFNSDDVNPIYWMIGTGAGIVCGTEAGEWLVQASALSDPITPTSIQAHRVTKYGCANIEPEHTELTISFVHRYGRKVLEYFPDVFSGKYNAPNLSHNAKHLTTSGIEEIRYQQELLPIIWARCADGSLIGATYKRSTLFSSQGPEFIGWHRHDLGGGRIVESISVGPSVDGSLDSLAMVTNDPATGVRHVEIVENIFDVDDVITSSWLVDDAVVPSGGVISGQTLTLSGLWHLNGETISVQCGGLDAGDATVANGAVSIPIDTDPTNPNTLTSAGLLALSGDYGTLSCPIIFGGRTITVPCVAGFTFTSQGQILRPDTAEQSRSPTGPGSAKPRRMHQHGALLQNTQGISFGTTFSKLHAAPLKSLGGTSLNASQLFSGVIWSTVDDTYGFDSMLCWQISRPYPAAVVSVSGFLNVQDR